MAGVHLSLPLGLLLLMSCAGADDASDRRGPPRFGSSGQGGSAGAANPVSGDTQTPATPTSGLGGNEGTPVITGIDPTLASGGAGAQLGAAGTQVVGAAGNAAAGAAGTSSDQPPSPLGASAGCGRIAPPSGELALQLGGVDAAYTVTLPPNYDPEVPSPLIFAFHGRGRTHVEFRQVDAAGIQTELGGRAVVAYLKSQGGNGWNFAEEVEPNVAFFESLYPRMLENYCVDPGRVFAVGHSSGGYFSMILACRFADRLRGIGSVAGASQENDCEGQVAALLIHGVRDSVVSFESGRAARDVYLARNACDAATSAAAVGPCVAYQGCADGFPVQWCEHEEPTYENTNHGWPSFASRAVGEFLFSLP